MKAFKHMTLKNLKPLFNNTKKHFHHNNLDQRGFSQVEFVWIGGTGFDIRSKNKFVKGAVEDISQLGDWNYDGSSTGQAETGNSEVFLKPVALFDDPFRGKPNKIALCESYLADGSPANTNFRHFAKKIFDKAVSVDPRYGMEQEFLLMKPIGTDLAWPYGWPSGNYPKPQFQYYCSNGSSNAYGREIIDSHVKACLNAGVEIFGTNAEVMPGQWEFQVGTSSGINIGDHMWMARFLLVRCAELHGVDVSFACKPIKGDWNGSGCHTNFCTKETRSPGGMKHIEEHMKRLSQNHSTSIGLYGSENKYRLTGHHETSSINKFSYGVANRGTSVRIPRGTERKGYGYYEDRRPASDTDPYVVSSSLVSITSLDNFGLKELVEHYNKFNSSKSL